MGKAVIISLGVAAAGAISAAAGLAAFLLRKKDEPEDALGAIRAPSSVNKLRKLQSMLSMRSRPPSWYESLPVFRLKNKRGMEVHVTPIGMPSVLLCSVP